MSRTGSNRGGKVNSKAKKSYIYLDYTMLFLLAFLVGFGLLMIYSSGTYSAIRYYSDANYFLKRQLVAVALGVLAMIFFFFVDFGRFSDRQLCVISWIAYGIGCIMMFLVVFIGRTVNGATRWIYIGSLSIQPVEIMKIAVIIWSAYFLYAIRDSLSYKVIFGAKEYKNSRKKLKKIVMIAVYFIFSAGIPFFLAYVITSNLSSAIILVGISVVMFFVAYPGYKLLLSIAALGVGGGGIWLSQKISQLKNSGADSFRGSRLLVWLNPENYSQGDGYQTVQALYAIGSGGIFGKGLGKSLQKMGSVPEAQNDMIFSIICEELGLFGALSLMIVFIVFLFRIYKAGQNSLNLFGKYICAGVFAHIAIQVILNIAVVTNVIPNTGVSLPFISYGGTSVLFLFIEIGMVLGIAKRNEMED